MAGIAAAQADGKVNPDLPADFLLTAVMTLATAYTAANPFSHGTADPAALRHHITEAIRLTNALVRNRNSIPDKTSNRVGTEPPPPHTDPMRDRLMSMPVWGLLPVAWLAWGAIFFVINLISRDGLADAVVLAAIAGAVMAAATVGPLKIRWRVEQRALGAVSPSERSTAVRAARTGPVPTDPEARAAALALAQGDLKRLHRTRPWMIGVIALLVVSEIGLAFTGSPWTLLLAVLTVPLLVFQVILLPKRLRNRIALLSAAQ